MDFVRALRTFMRVVESGSFSQAAEQLSTSSAAVSRQVAALERHLAVRLLNRTTRKVSLTSSGKAFAVRAGPLLNEIEDAESFAGGTQHAVSGTLRIAAPLSFGVAQLPPLLAGFRHKQPHVKLDVDLSDRVVDLAADGFDLALRIAREPSQHLVVRRLARVGLVLCAAPSYLRARGYPSSPSELSHHQILSYSYLSFGRVWPFTDRKGRAELVRIDPIVSATNGDILRDLAVSGAGIILQPTFIVRHALARGSLVRLLPEWSVPELSLYAAYLSHRHLSPKVRAFVDHLVQAIGADPEWEVWEPADDLPVRQRALRKGATTVPDPADVNA